MSKDIQRRRTLDASAPPATSRNPASRRKLTTNIVTKSEAAAASDDNVLVTVPTAFRLALDHHHEIPYQAGTYKMPKEHAEHWWAKANGVKLAN